MKHPFQILITDKAGKHLFVSVKNHLLVFRLSDGELVGSWSDNVDSQAFQAERFLAKRAIQRELEDESVPKKKKKSNKKEPKVPVPGPGAPIIYNYIRSLTLTRNEEYVIGTTDSDKAAVLFKIDYTQENCLELIKRQIFPKRPCAVSTTIDDSTLVVADKFGDVYSVPIDCKAPAEEKSLVPILGHVSMLSDVLVAEQNGKQFILTGDRDEHIRVTHYPKSYVAKHWLFGHKEFVSCLHLADFDNDVLISGGGDDYLLMWKWFTEEQLARIDLRELIQPFLTDSHFPPERFLLEDSPMEISIVKALTYTKDNTRLLAVLCENTKCILTFVIHDDYSVTHKQTFATENSLIDFVMVDGTIIAAIDTESDDTLLEFYKLDGDFLLQKEDADLAKKISCASECEVEARENFYPLYYISSLRKRSEH